MLQLPGHFILLLVRAMRHNQTQWADLFLFVSLFFGAIVRFAPTVISGSVINDGGMFYAMIEDLKATGFLLPSATTYNNLQIPFAYHLFRCTWAVCCPSLASRPSKSYAGCRPSFQPSPFWLSTG